MSLRIIVGYDGLTEPRALKNVSTKCEYLAQHDYVNYIFCKRGEFFIWF